MVPRSVVACQLILPACTIAAVVARKGEETDAVPQIQGWRYCYINPAISRFVPSGVFEVIKQLPGGDEPEHYAS
jgi:hypothetical protein